MFTRPDNWAELTWQEKREARFQHWLNPPDVKFDSPEAEAGYKARATRLAKAAKMEIPDRVPVMLPSGFFPAYYAGYDLKTVMNDYDKLAAAWLKFAADFDTDSFTGPGIVLPAKVMEMTGHRLHQWPGHGLPEHISIYQYVEREYMKADEYDDFLGNPGDFWWRCFLPRVAGAFESFRKLAPFSGMMGIPLASYAPLGEPDVEAAMLTMIAAGKETRKWQQAVGEISRATQAAGFPEVRGGAMSGAPYDMIADMLRGTQGAVMDIYRQPDKLHAAMAKVAPLAVRSAVAMADASGSPFCFMPLHKGDESFMSPRQFEEFYWPSFRQVLTGLIEAGLVPLPFAEGRYGARLEVIKDLPRGSVIWLFEDIDMARAKQILGNHACIAGNVPASLMHTGTPAQVKEYCRKLIETCAPGGGYILSGAAGMNEGDPAVMRAMMDTVKKYGVY